MFIASGENFPDALSISTNAHGNEAFAFDSSGQVWAWGMGANGEFGNGASIKNQTTSV